MKRKQIGTYKGKPVYEKDTYKQVIKRKVKKMICRHCGIRFKSNFESCPMCGSSPTSLEKYRKQYVDRGKVDYLDDTGKVIRTFG